MTSAGPPGHFYGYRIIAAAFVSQFLAMGIFSYVLGPFMLPMIEELGWSRAEYTLSRSLGQLIMGIGHRIKSVTNPDKRVTLIRDFAVPGTLPSESDPPPSIADATDLDRNGIWMQ